MTWPHAFSFERRVPIAWARLIPFPPVDASRNPHRRPVVLPDQIIAEVARKHGLGVRELRGRSRIRVHVAARHEAMWRLRTELEMSFARVAAALGLLDHSSVIHGVRRHAQRMQAHA